RGRHAERALPAYEARSQRRCTACLAEPAAVGGTATHGAAVAPGPAQRTLRRWDLRRKPADDTCADACDPDRTVHAPRSLFLMGRSERSGGFLRCARPPP